MDSKDKNSYKEKVASFILGGSGFGSRMMEKIRVQEGLAYSVYSYTSIQKSHSSFNGYLQTKLQNQTKAKNLVIQIIDDFIKNGATQKELDSAKQFLLGSQPLRTETFSQRQNRAFKLYYKGLPLDFPKKELKLIENLTLKDLNNFIKSHKEIKNLSFSILTK
jgi:predicted Zn-dependent peptidase